MRELTIRVPSFPPSLNKASRNWWVNHEAAGEFADMVRLCAIDARNRWEGKRRWPTLDKAIIFVTFIVPESRHGPMPDAHNLFGSMKKAIDVLTARPSGTGEYARVGIGLIADDAPTCLTWGNVGVIREGTEEVTEIVIRG